MDYLLVLAWNMVAEIKAKTSGLHLKYIDPVTCQVSE